MQVILISSQNLGSELVLGEGERHCNEIQSCDAIQVTGSLWTESLK